MQPPARGVRSNQRGWGWNAHGTARRNNEADWVRRFDTEIAGGILAGELDFDDVVLYRCHFITLF